LFDILGKIDAKNISFWWSLVIMIHKLYCWNIVCVSFREHSSGN
jgi:hypothetical protein